MKHIFTVYKARKQEVGGFECKGTSWLLDPLIGFAHPDMVNAPRWSIMSIKDGQIGYLHFTFVYVSHGFSFEFQATFASI